MALWYNNIVMFKYYFVYFIITAFIGYIYETTAMVVWSGKWQARGFLFGPIIPIYGIGAFIGLILFTINNPNASMLTVFLTGFIGSVVLEYPTSWALEKLFHACWWDYSIAPFNINGRVSLFSSLGFGLAALVIVYVINPVLWPALLKVNPILIEVLSYIFVALVVLDTTLRVCVLNGFENRIHGIQENINDRLGDVVENINPKGRNLKRVIIQNKEDIEKKDIDRLIKSMGSLHKIAIYKIVGFKETSGEAISSIKSRIKERIDNIRNQNER